MSTDISERAFEDAIEASLLESKERRGGGPAGVLHGRDIGRLS